MKLLKNKKVLIGISSVFVIILCICICFYMNKDNSDDEMYTSNIDDEKENSVGGFLTLMLETEADSGVYEKSTSSTWPGEGYVFNENLSSCENGGELSWNEELGAVNLKTNIAEKCYVYFDVAIPPTLAEYIINNVYVEDGVNDLYYHDGQGTYTNADQEAGDNSYRYAGVNPNNYVCFGSDASTCPSDNLYRIIGVFGNELKLIKADFANSNLLGTDGAYGSSYVYYWNSTYTNIWSESDLNTVNLNQNYLNNIGSKWQNKIAEHTWQVGGVYYETVHNSPVQTVYNYEVGANSANKTYNAKIGLMYVSDYGFAASPDYWTTELYNYDQSKSSNWMNINLTEWTISPFSNTQTSVWTINSSGKLYDGDAGYADYGVRPVFYLISDTKFVSGSGTESDPIRIN